MNTNLKDFGFDSRFEVFAAEYSQWMPARVLIQEKGLYTVVSESGEGWAEVSGRFRFEAEKGTDYPAVGDFVMIDPNPNGRAIIHRVLPRKSSFIRKAAFSLYEEQIVAANIDTVYLCMALNGNFKLRRLERYLTLAWDSGAIPVVLLTKADLCEDLPEKLAAVESIAAGADILVTSAFDEKGCQPLMPYLQKGKTVAFIGSSGVGKSTLINRLLGAEILATNGLRDDDRGRHTTTRRQLMVLPCGAMVIDTPGMRELGMTDEAGLGLEQTFGEIEVLVHACRFADCTHTGEPGCAVQAALEKGELLPERWLAYQKLLKEAKYAESQAEYLKEKRKHFKQISKNKRNRDHKR